MRGSAESCNSVSKNQVRLGKSIKKHTQRAINDDVIRSWRQIQYKVCRHIRQKGSGAGA